MMTSTKIATKPEPVRMYSKDLNALIEPLKPTGMIPNFFAKDKNISSTISAFIEIETFLKQFSNHPEDLVIDHVSKLGISQELIEQLTAKMFELVEMFEQADNDEYEHHLSIGSIRNVGMSVCRRVLLIAIDTQIKPEMEVFKPCYPDLSTNPYPFVNMPDVGLLKYLSSLFLRIYKFKLTQQLFPLYACACARLCFYTRYVTFITKYPQNHYWQLIYDAVFNLFKDSNIKPSEDKRYWVDHTIITNHTEEEENKTDSTNQNLTLTNNAFPSLNE